MQGQKSIKLKPQTQSAAAKAAALRAQVQLELQNKKQCAYQPYECTQLTLDGYNYCLRHILEDKNAPFKQCAYVYTSNGKRCYLPAPKGDKKEFGYCNEHALKTHLSKARQGTRYPPPRTAEVLLHSLSHYVKKPRSRTVSSTTQYSDEGGRTSPEESDPKVTKSLDPFVDIDAFSINAALSDVLDMCSESESDVEAATHGAVWPDAQADSSDNESIDSDQEDLLKHANVFTAEEITLVTREKLIKLQSLYIDQYRHLQYVLRERRRKYLHNLKREKETCCSIHNQVRDNPKEQRLYRKLKAYNQYHRKHGVEAILNKRVNELRMKITEGMAPKPPTYAKCAFTEGGVKCGERALPVARHCRKHILEDPNQVLFRACGKMKADVECTTPVEAIFDDTTCPLHMDIPQIRSYAQTRKDSESDYDDSIEVNNSNTIPSDFLSTIKAEYLDVHSDSQMAMPYDNAADVFMATEHSIKEEIVEQLSDMDVINNTEEFFNLHADDVDMDESHKMNMDETSLLEETIYTTTVFSNGPEEQMDESKDILDPSVEPDSDILQEITVKKEDVVEC